MTSCDCRLGLPTPRGAQIDTAGRQHHPLDIGAEYHAGIRLVVDVAKAAKEQMHHPDIDIGCDTIRFFITTHHSQHAGWEPCAVEPDLQ